MGERSNPEFEAQRIADVCDGKLPLKLEYQKLGAFQKPSNARVLWIGVKSSGINALASKIRLISESEDRPFLPHITISRFKRQTNLESLVSKHAETKFGGGIATNLSLIHI